ncbi:RNA polymerase sigma factor [Negadavirga shengliensis]|uniref:RNA polymerase sigma factor n=1 Tax=Negadavirga shengliensis TaxID=1389218 RepID=A0ABV9SW46_9BACT
MKHTDLLPHLFRTEYRKIASVLCKNFGIDHIEAAEDIASETFLAAYENWTYKGIPDYPTAWLYAVAKNKAKNYLNREKLFSEKIKAHVLANGADRVKEDVEWSAENITDSQLQMLFAICRPSIPVDAQIGLALRILCGFGIEEIANAFLTNKETINKRLFRAKQKLRQENVKIRFPDADEVDKRLDTVMTTLYLLFNEGYYSESNDEVLREELCLEAMRLVLMLIENHKTNRPFINALMALMCFHASRFPARKNQMGELILYDNQDVSLWNQELIAKGVYYLHLASVGNSLSRYHLEAGIAYWHTQKPDSAVKWKNILKLYDHLLEIADMPIAALNRILALSKVSGKEAAIVQAESLKLEANPYYHRLLGELYIDVDLKKARSNLEKALDYARTAKDKQIIAQRILSVEKEG